MAVNIDVNDGKQSLKKGKKRKRQKEKKNKNKNHEKGNQSQTNKISNKKSLSNQQNDELRVPGVVINTCNLVKFPLTQVRISTLKLVITDMN